MHHWDLAAYCKLVCKQSLLRTVAALEYDVKTGQELVNILLIDSSVAPCHLDVRI